MTLDQHSSDWIPPCDLCGGFRYDAFPISGGRAAHRCRDCGLITLGNPDSTTDQFPRFAIPVESLVNAMKGMAGARVLVLGPIDDEFRQRASEADVVLETIPTGPPDLPSRPPALENLRFLPETFDAVIATAGLEWFESPSLIFERSRLWLRAGGILLVGAWDMRSLPARLRRKTWMRLRSAGAHYLMSLSAIRRYAARYGYYIGAVRTKSRARDIAASITGNNEPTLVSEVASTPLAFVSTILGMGPMVIVQLSKGGLSTRAVRLDTETESKSAPGLAPAMFVAD
jgi:hypothetical protein